MLVDPGDRRQPLEPSTEVVAEEADETATERGHGRGRVPPGLAAAHRRVAIGSPPIRARIDRASANGSGPSAAASTTAMGSAVR